MRKPQNLPSYSPEIESEQEASIASIVREAGKLSRGELVRRTGLNRGALAARLKSLEQKRLIEEVGPGASGGGRPPNLIRFSKDAAYLVAVDLGATSLDVAVTNLGLEVKVHRAQPCDVTAGPGVVLPMIKMMIGEVVAEAGLDRDAVKGIGMGIPGPVEFKTGRPVSPPIMPGWHLFPVRDYLEAEFGWPVYVDNDVNIMALGEYWAGSGRGVDNFIFVKVGTGIGCGVFCRGQLYRGTDGSAGDIGHVEVTAEPVVCRCGNTGCLEALAGGAALARASEEAALEGRSPYLVRLLAERGSITAADLGHAIGRGDPFAVELVRTSGSRIGHTLAGLVNFFNPALIVIGGGVANLGDLMLASIRETVYRRSLPLATRNILIRPSELGGRAGVIGGAALLLEELFRLRSLGHHHAAATHAYVPGGAHPPGEKAG